MRAQNIKELYDEYDELRPEELRRLTPGTPEFAALDAKVRRMRGVRGATVVDKSYARLNQAVSYSGADLDELPVFSDDVLERLRSFFALGPRKQNHIVSDDELAYNLLNTYMRFRDLALIDEAPPLPNEDEPHHDPASSQETRAPEWLRQKSIKELYDENDVIKPDELRRLTPGTTEFAVLDATVRRARHPTLNGHFARLNQAIVYSGSPIEELPGFSDDALKRLRSFLAEDAGRQDYFITDNAELSNLLRTYMWVRNLALTEPAEPDNDPARPLLSRHSFQAALNHEMVTLYARRGDPDPLGSAIRTNAVRLPRPTRRFSQIEVQRLKGHWSVLGREPSVHDDQRTIVCPISEKASIRITSERIQCNGWSTLDEREKIEAVRLGVLHAREHWNAAHSVLGWVPDHTLYMLAFSELLGVQVTGDHLAIPREEIDACKSKLQALYPEKTESRSTEGEARKLHRADSTSGPTRPTGKVLSRRSLLSLCSLER